MINDECGSDNDGGESDDGIESRLRSKAPFSELKLTMEKLPNANIYKRIVKNGFGDVIGSRAARVQWNYDAFTENETRPYDTSYKSDAKTISTTYHQMHTGVWLSLETMRKGEEAEFIIDYRLMFGDIGFLPRIKQKADILLVAKLVDFEEINVEDATEQQSSENRRKFQNVKKKVMEMRDKALSYARCERYRIAWRTLSSAARMLELCQLANEFEQNEQHRMLIDFFTDLMGIFAKDNEHRKVCLMVNELRRLKNVKADINVLLHEAIAVSHIDETSQRALEIIARCEKIDPGNEFVAETKIAIIERSKSYEDDMKMLWQRAMSIKSNID